MITVDDDGVIVTPFMKTPYNHNTAVESDNTATVNDEPSKTQQNFKDETDINTIIDRFGVENVAQDPRLMPSSEDFMEAFDFQSAQNTIRQAQEAFMDLPADVRAEFDNDPAKLIRFVEDERNTEKAIAMGIAFRRPEEKPDETPPKVEQTAKE